MKTTLFSALLLLAAAAHANPDSLQQLQACAAGQCFDTKGQPVSVPPPGSAVFKEPVKLDTSVQHARPEPPRYTVLSKEEVQRARDRQAVVGTVLSAGVGAMFGAFVGGVPGAIVGGLLGAAAAYVFLKVLKKG